MNRTTPVLVQMPPGVSFTDVTGGLGFSMALDSDGKAWAWGNNANGQLGDGTHTNRNVPVPVVMPPGLTFTAISNLGDAHSLALAAGGAAWAWGDNAFGQVGDGTNTDRDVPVAVQMPPGVTFTSIYSGDFHSLGLAPDGTAWAWGLNNRSQLGDGTSTNRNAPVRVQTPGGVILTEVSAGDFHSLALGTRAVGS